MKLHLGCGPNYIRGWVNVDLDSPVADIQADLRLALPFPDDTVDFIFCEHFIEHITRSEALGFLGECRRVLTHRGIIRLSTPDLRWLTTQYLSGNLAEWTDVGWTPQTSCQLINEGMRAWGHQFIYDHAELISVMRQAGFNEIQLVPHRASNQRDLAGLECRPWHHELIVEASGTTPLDLGSANTSVVI